MITRFNPSYILKVDYFIDSTILVIYFVNGEKIWYEASDDFEKFKIIDSVSNRYCTIEIKSEKTTHN